MDKLDAGQLIAALKSGGSLEGPLKASRFVSNGVEISAPDKDTPADAPEAATLSGSKWRP